MYPYYASPPPFFPVTPVVTPVAANVPLPPSPYGAPMALPGLAAIHPAHAVMYAAHPGYGHAQYVPYYGQGLPAAAAPAPHPSYQPSGTQLHLAIQPSRPPRVYADFTKPSLAGLHHWNHSPVPTEVLNAPATWPAASHLRLIAPGFPWFIEIDTSKPGDGDAFLPGSPVTVGMLFQRIHTLLRSRITQSEWNICSKDKKKTLINNFNARTEKDSRARENGLAWVDWLENPTFYGLTKDEKVAEDVLQRRAKDIPETWTIVFGPKR
ncbi:hypothetical protein BKA62DRAFT_639060 [Auriculariales sp. MPI-PUGE-AT-0066]|nr:hypothetical protein BKA62DRAFT_639060 [Auriculariales sp. MPI-PUGE-AT-0066]